MKGIRNGKRALDKKSKRSMDTHIVADSDLLIKSKSKKLQYGGKKSMDNSLTVETVLSQREKYNLAFPFIAEQQQINPYYKLIVSQYRVDISPDSKDFC